MKPKFPNVRLHIVTGKGGTGKTTVAAALAVALASEGRRTLLMEVEGRQGLAQLFDTPPLPYQERRVALAPNSGEVLALAVDPQEALLDYLEMFYNLRRAGAALAKLGAVDFATTIAPGVRDILLTGKAIEAVRRQEDGQRVFDAVVLDAPPTGRITRFLNVNAEVAGIARVGPIHSQANSVMSVLRSPRTAVHVVTLLEEMPVQETLDGIAELRAEKLPVGAVLVNMTTTSSLGAADLELARFGNLDRAGITAAVGRAQVAANKRASSVRAVVDALMAEADDLATRDRLQIHERQALRSAERPIVELGLAPTGIDAHALQSLALQLREQGFGPAVTSGGRT